MATDPDYDDLNDLDDTPLLVLKGKNKVGASSSGTSSKKCKVTSKNKQALPVNPDEPVRTTWVKIPTDEFERDRLDFNPYAFGERTCSDSRFYCKMHQQVYEFLVCLHKNTHVPQHCFDLTKARDVWPEVMEVMDFHGITSLMACNTSYSPDFRKSLEL